MSFRRQILKELTRLKELLIDRDVIHRRLEEVIIRLEEQNAELFNRLMSRDFQEFAVYKDERPNTEISLPELSALEDENNAGEILDLGEEDAVRQ